MKEYIKGAWISFKDYLIMSIIFVVFLVPILSLCKENLIIWVHFYSIAIFILMLLIIYTDFHQLAVKEKRPQYDLHPYPLKGFVYGLVSLVPFALIGILYPVLTFSNPLLERLKHLIYNSILGPLYWFIHIGNESIVSYILSVFIIPIIAGLAYLAGNKGFYIKKSNKPGAMIKKNQNRSAKH